MRREGSHAYGNWSPLPFARESSESPDRPLPRVPATLIGRASRRRKPVVRLYGPWLGADVSARDGCGSCSCHMSAGRHMPVATRIASRVGLRKPQRAPRLAHGTAVERAVRTALSVEKQADRVGCRPGRPQAAPQGRDNCNAIVACSRVGLRAPRLLNRVGGTSVPAGVRSATHRLAKRRGAGRRFASSRVRFSEGRCRLFATDNAPVYAQAVLIVPTRPTRAAWTWLRQGTQRAACSC
jgi:hypothetical protein